MRLVSLSASLPNRSFVDVGQLFALIYIYIYIFFFIGFTVVTGKSDVSILSLVIG